MYAFMSLGPAEFNAIYRLTYRVLDSVHLIVGFGRPNYPWGIFVNRMLGVH